MATRYAPRGHAFARKVGSSSRRHGKCKPCRVIWIWNGPILVREAKCPTCGLALARTAAALDKKSTRREARCTDRGLRS